MARWKNWLRVGFVLVLGAALLWADLFEGITFGIPKLHLVEEAIVFLVGLGWITHLLIRGESIRRSAVSLVDELRSARTALEATRSEMISLSKGLADKVDQTLVEWGLTPSEREVATLLLKGLGLRQISEIRNTSQRTARQQAASVYKKAGLAGRAELSAYFFEDILVLPEDADSTEPLAARG